MYWQIIWYDCETEEIFETEFVISDNEEIVESYAIENCEWLVGDTNGLEYYYKKVNSCDGENWIDLRE